MRLANPWWLILLVLVVLLWVWERCRPRMLWPTLAMFRGRGRSGHAWMRQVPLWMRAVAIACLVLAMARPQTVAGRTRIAGQGVAIVVILDNSTSMDAEDFPDSGGPPISRLEAARRTLDRFVVGRPDDLIGLVAFANYPDLTCPPTLDQEFLRATARSVRSARPGENGTNIGDAVAWGLEAVLAAPPEQKVLILLTDGENQPAVPDPLDPEAAARLSGELGVTLHAIGIGADGGIIRPIEPTTGLPQPIQVEGPNMDLLESMARLGGGRAFQATDAETLNTVFDEIDRLETSPVVGIIRTRYKEEYPPLVAAALALLILDRLLALGRLRRLP
ncbi:VWA domain-containing protein [soil metagenome]